MSQVIPNIVQAGAVIVFFAWMLWAVMTNPGRGDEPPQWMVVSTVIIIGLSVLLGLTYVIYGLATGWCD